MEAKIIIIIFFFFFFFSFFPQSYIRPESDRPRLSQVSACDDVPVIDLNSPDKPLIVQKVGHACKSYGFFQVINHWVNLKAVKKMLEVAYEFFGLIPRHKVFGNLIEELTQIVERQFLGSSPLVENSTRTWTFIASRFIYSYTNDVISGSLALAVLLSFLISRHEMPKYVFVIWAIFVVPYLIAAIPEN